MHLKLALLGFGNVGQELAKLLMSKQAALLSDYDLTWQVVGISARSKGMAINPQGLDLEAALAAVAAGETLASLHTGPAIEDTEAFIAACDADLFFEGTYTNPHDGEPALSYVRAALEKGAHVVSANKGPVAFGHHALQKLAREKGVGFFSEGAVMDGAPVIGMGREALPVSTFKRIRGILNSTTNYILTRMEDAGLSFDTALKEAQDMGVAEADPSLDVDGWDASIKIVILANVLMGADLRPADVKRTGIGDITMADVQAARDAGQRTKLVCEAIRAEDGTVSVSVAPQRVPTSDPLSLVTGMTSIVDYETEDLPRLTLIEHDPGPDTTAYGMLADMVNIARGRHLS